MKRILAVVAFVVSAAAMPSLAQTPEADLDQSSIAGDGISYIDTSGSDLAVVAYGVKRTNNSVLFVIHNGTDGAVSNLSVKLEIRNDAGQIRAVGTANGGTYIQPQTLLPGDIGIGWLSPDGSFDIGMNFTFTITNFDDTQSSQLTNISFGEVNMFDDAIVGEIINPAQANLSSVTLIGICFDESGDILEFERDSVDEELPPDVPVSFSVGFGFVTEVGCDSFIIGGSGY